MRRFGSTTIFCPVIAPLFFIETLADLEKTPRGDKTAEDEVAIIARKTPQMSGAPCFNHNHLCTINLLGYRVPMNGQIPVAQGRAVMRNGKIGSIVDEPEEARAFKRWQRGQFLELEYQHARAWRAQLAQIDLRAISAAMKAANVDSKSCKTLEAARDMARDTVSVVTKSTGRFDAALHVLQVPIDAHKRIRQRWKSTGHPPLSRFAPYAAHVLTVSIFFDIGLGASLISSERASHQVDIAYLYYLPFCHAFASTDKLHRTVAPLFLRDDQRFVWGGDLKTDLGHLNAHFLTLPAEVRARGLNYFARRLPAESQGLIRELLAQYTPGSLKHAQDIQVTPEQNAKIVEEMQQWRSAQTIADRDVPQGVELETLILERSVSRQRGSWTQLGADVKDTE